MVILTLNGNHASRLQHTENYPSMPTSGAPSYQLEDLKKNEKQPDTDGVGRFKPTADDDACFGLWNMYISQAHEYDKALLEGWKGDMDGILLFSALYSATLTALIVESYKKLQLDPADLTTSLLTTISLQLASISNGTTTTVGLSDTSFKPMTSSLICNMLWFLSLALALTCSLLATFVQQWTRDFLHKTTMRPSPVVQARVLAFSYFGLRRFGMHTFVDVIPILLHISLFFFFAGLVAFLLPVNLPLTILMACVLFIFVLVYSALTLHPLQSLDTPYRTPFSDLLWHVANGFFARRNNLASELSLTEAMVERSLHKSPDRDSRCMEFTMKSLNHDTELVPMFMAVSDALASPQTGGVRLANFGIVAPLIQSPNPENNMISRIHHFISVSGSLAGDPERRVRNLEHCLHALTSFGWLVVKHGAENVGSDYSQYPIFWFQRDLVELLSSSPSLPQGYLILTIAALQTSRVQGFRRCIEWMSEALSSSKTNTERLGDARSIFTNLSREDIDWISEKFTPQFDQLDSTLQNGCMSGMTETDAAALVQQAQEHIAQLMDMSRWKAALISVLSQFLSAAVDAALEPLEMTMSFDLIHTSIPRLEVFDQSLDVEEDEAQATYLLQSTSTEPGSVSPELFILVFKLLFSTKRALHFPGAVECRKIIYKYLNNCTTNQAKLLVESDPAHRLEECALLDLSSDGAGDLARRWILGLDTLYHSMGFNESVVPPRLLSFAKEIFRLIPTASTNFTQDRWWFCTSTDTERILCKDIIKKLEYLSRGYDISNSHDISSFITPTMSDIHALGQKLLPELPVPECPSPCSPDEYQHWITEIQDYVLSMHLLITAKYIRITSEDIRITVGDWNNIGFSTQMHHGHIYKTVQLQFANSVWKLVSRDPWKHGDSPKSVLFHHSLWRLSPHWCWVTDVGSAKILAKAIRRHKSDANFAGIVWYEQACLDRCMEVIRKAEIVEEEDEWKDEDDEEYDIEDEDKDKE
ncbi:hypothetical protein D9758_001556 [Tetrapyrgos nigripes]|uniref:DUF6535 domain-containing protein n=1 Tax=Tetrapyrgos nigripes TaxID=182062 RepID=A0A8H5LXE5_9AGAR|nr:hypothetical protein D9758_001556 [Tetrapyrgos nigripes]